MGVQEIGPAKTRRAARETGLPIFRALRGSNRHWYGFVREGEGHYHIELDPETWEWWLAEDAPYAAGRKGCHFTSCGEGQWEPLVDPPARNTGREPE